LWTVDPANPPRLFENLTFAWVFELESGSSDQYSSTVLYADPRTAWQTDFDTAQLVQLAIPGGRFTPSTLAEPIERVRALIRANTDAAANVETNTLRIVSFDAILPADPCRADGTLLAPQSGQAVPCDASAIAEVYVANDYQLIQTDAGGYNQVQDAVAGQLFDALYSALWADDEIPDWFRYGLRRFYAPGVNGAELDTARRYLRTNRAISDLTITPDVALLPMWQAQSYSTVLYMAEQLGVPGLFALARDLATGDSLPTLYESATGQSLASITPAWSNWVFTQAAQNAHQYTPYLPPTRTPTLTLTRTPTITRTPSPTLTLTLTPSVTGVLSSTPSDTPTITPTFTLSVTPRPAGSLNTPTPAPVMIVPPPSEVVSQDPTLLTVDPLPFLAVLVVIGVIGIAAILWLTRPKK
ncbi:MAG: hypothetical protein H7Y11_12935, partial [Armatimonadetes bacterium]|nr:hypothetical protein [Anaerolineae bacterium]